MKQIAYTALGVIAAIGLYYAANNTSSTSLQATVMNKTTSNNPVVLLNTTKGDIKIEVFKDDVPTIATNFIDLVEAKKYDNTPFHRVIEGFMIQGGDYENGNGTGGKSASGTELKDEISPKYSHLRGYVSMANRGPNTNGSQFFIMHQDGQFLDGKYSLFGRVLDGMDVVDAIATTQTGFMDKPVEAITITKASVIK